MENIYDIIVIGGGPAGIMAAGKAAEKGVKILLLEKNNKLGLKLLLTGGGRGNISNSESNSRKLAEKYGKEGAFILSPLSVFGVKETISFFEKRELKLKTEKDGRVFPVTDSSKSVLNILIDYLKSGNVEIKTNSEIKKITAENNQISKIILENGQELKANNYVIATGGKSFSETGSTGEGYIWLEDFGHKVIKPRPGLVPVKIKEDWVKKAQGLSLNNIKLTLFLNDKKKESYFGEILFTHFGISGPTVLNMSSKIGEFLEKGEVKVILDLKPNLNIQSLDNLLQSNFKKYGNKLVKNSFENLSLPQRLIPIIIGLSKIDPLKKGNEITKEERFSLVSIIKSIRMQIDGLLGFDAAMITQGGVSLKEIDARTMRSKIIKNLYLAGEIINLHGPTGGYNLQLCWTTGYIAGENASK
jgi:hypothetical protein